MDFIKGNNLNQMIFSTLEMKIEQDNLVRFVDALSQLSQL